MTEAKVIFIYKGESNTIQCSYENMMRDICQIYLTKVNKNINSLIFFYGGIQVNFELQLKNQINIIDKNKNIINIFVNDNESINFICPKCKSKIEINKDKFDDIIFIIYKIDQTIEVI